MNKWEYIFVLLFGLFCLLMTWFTSISVIFPSGYGIWQVNHFSQGGAGQLGIQTAFSYLGIWSFPISLHLQNSCTAVCLWVSIQEAARTLPSLFRCGGLGGTSTNLNLDKCDNFPPFHALQCSQLGIHFSAIAGNALVPVSPADAVTTGCE